MEAGATDLDGRYNVRKQFKRLAVLATAFVIFAAPAVAGAIGGFNWPLFGLATAPNGDLLVPDYSAGVFKVRNEMMGSAVGPLQVTDVSPIGTSSWWVTTGAGADPTMDTGQAIYRVSPDETVMVANLYTHEATVNPDGNDPPDSNPFDVQSLGGQAALVADAGANALLEVHRNGNIDVLAVFPDEPVSTANIKALVGCPTPPPGFEFVCGLPDLIPAQAVPTSIAIGPDGYYYVGELKGFPAPTGQSNIWKVAPDASEAMCGSSPDCVKVFEGGFTSIIDLAFGPDGKLYVSELDEDSWVAVEFLGGGSGGTINACHVGTLSCQEVETAIPIHTAIAFDKDGTLWATRNALIPGLAEVFEVD